MFYVNVLCGVRYVSMGLRQEEDLIEPMEDDIKLEHHKEIMLEACHPLW